MPQESGVATATAVVELMTGKKDYADEEGTTDQRKDRHHELPPATRRIPLRGWGGH